MKPKKILLSAFTLLIIIAIGTFAWFLNARNNDKSITSSIDQSNVMIQEKVSETKQIESVEPKDLIHSFGNFIEIDSVHKASGKAEIVKENGKIYVKFAENFDVVPLMMSLYLINYMLKIKEKHVWWRVIIVY